MRKFLSTLTYAGLILSSCLFSNKLHADSRTKDNCFPVVALDTTPILLSNDTAFSLLLEAGARSNRVNGTLGFIGNDCNLFKISAEYLSQKLHYKFDSGKLHRWLHQFALGAKYQHRFDCPNIINAIEFGFIYSNAPNKHLSDEPILLTDSSVTDGNSGIQDLNAEPKIGIPVGEAADLRKIAGGDCWELDVGFLMNPWCSGNIIPSISYQQVTYSRHYKSRKRLSGIGAGIVFNQRLHRNFSFDLEFQFRQAYNDLRAALNWNKVYRCGALGLGVFIDHVYGKRGLPSSTTSGVEISFAFGVCGCSKVSLLNSCEPNCSYQCLDSLDLLAWVSAPAVYMPQVLAIADEQLCYPPSDSLPLFFSFSPGIVQIDLNQYFNVQDNDAINYEVTFTSTNATPLFNKESGIITLNLPQNYTPFTVNITATNECGVDSTSFNVSLD